MPKTSWWLVMCLTGTVVLASPQSTGVDAGSLAKIRDEGMNRSKVAEPFDMFVNVIGPRLTGSPAHKRAADYAKATLEQWGMTNVHLESWEFGRGWDLQKLTVEMVEPRYMPLIGYAEAWTSSTPGEMVVSAVSIAGKSADEIAAMPIAGSAVLSQPVITNFIEKDRDQPTLVPNARTGAPASPRQGAAGAGGGRTGANGRSASAAPAGAATAGQGRGNPGAVAKAAVLIKPSLGTDGTVFVQAGRDNPAAPTPPAIVLAAEHYNIIARLLEHKIPVKLRVNVQSKFYDTDKNSYNVIADIPGTDPVLKNEVVMLGGHLDSWHSATGATDNADGVAEIMEAFRLIKASGLQPKRTLRLAIWSGEEEGLYGSKAFVKDHLTGDAHKADRDKFDVYFNIDPGTGPIYGWYMENNPAAKTMFDAWLEPLKDLGMRSNVIAGIPSTDHLSFKDVGLQGFTPIQDYTDYDVREHHTNVDTAERVNEPDMRQASVVLAWFAYSAAMSSERVPAAPAGAAQASAPVAGATRPSAQAAASTSATARNAGVVKGFLKNASGTAVANGRVQLRGVPSGVVAGDTRTDAQGAFTFTPVAAGDYNVTHVSDNGVLIALGSAFTLQTGESVATVVQIAGLQPALPGAAVPPASSTDAPASSKSVQLTTVVGYLREGSSKAIPDAAVQLRDAKTNAVIASVRTNATGAFEFGRVSPGTYVVIEVADKDQKILGTGSPFAVQPGQLVTNYIRVKGKSIR